ncbi:MAG: hypothetical protein MK193_06345, partial [Lentisphaeria bacterium]|nr:hypothetical protein [Lentisphaeria bacterium]
MRIFLLFCLLAFFISCSPKPAESGDLNRIRMDESDEVYIMTKNIQTGEENKILLNRNRGNTFIFGFENGSEDDTSIPEFQQVLNARVGAGHERKGGAKNQHVVKTGVIEITEHDSKERYATRLQFEYQNPKHPQLQYLYKKEKLAELKQDSEFETLIHVLNWTRQQWEPGSPEIYPPWNANVILSSIRAGQTSGFCAQYSQVLVQTLTAMGHQARYLWLTEHFGVEVFSNELNQWLIIDPLYNCVIKQGDKFLNAYDVFTALQSEDKGA